VNPRPLLLSLALLALVRPVPAQVPSAGLPEVSAFARLPVLENGRVMPMDSYARLKLLEFSGREKIADLDFNQRDWQGKPQVVHREPAVSWLARVLFTPASTATNQIFLINHPELLAALHVPARDGRRYSYDDLKPGAQKLSELARRAGTAQSDADKAALTLVDKEAYRVFANLTQYLMLTVAFEYARPSPQLRIENAELRQKLELPADSVMFSFLDLFERMGSMAGIVQQVASKPSADWTPLEEDTMRVAFALKEMSERYQRLHFTPLPAAPHGEQQYLSPWDALAFGRGDPALMQAVAAYARLANAYVLSDAAAFQTAAEAVATATRDRWPYKEKSLRRAAQETRFNEAQHFLHAKIWYICAFLLSFIAFVSGNVWLRRGALVLVLLAVGYHTAGLVWRIVLTGRPPVTNLYGTFIFVSLACVFLGLALEAFQRNALGLFGGSLVAVIFLFIAQRFALEGDTMGKLVAVLDSNFWLSTHVVAISVGYAGAWMAGVVAHVYLVLALFHPPHRARMRPVYNAMTGLLAFGLTFSFLGTMLGGVWADQSWGRFWGWDPKENGALLIVLWTAVLYHARVGGMVAETGLAAGVAFGNLVVMAAWLGTNLLGVGLHSYGFTQGVTEALLAYFAVDTLLIAGLWGAARLRQAGPPKPQPATA
jgi:ABC-type transport system involved in cytochrome c biogenesis permease subunit